MHFNFKFQTLSVGFFIVCMILLPLQLQNLYASNQPDLEFDKSLAFEHLEKYDQLSPLLPGSENSQDFLKYAKNTLENSLWTVESQSWEHTSPQVTLNLTIIYKTAE